MTYRRIYFREKGEDLPGAIPLASDHSVSNVIYSLRKINAVRYFENIADNDENLESFQKHWREIPSVITEPRDLSVVIAKVADWVNALPDNHKSFVVDFLNNNLQFWEEGARNAIRGFDPEDLGRSIMAFATLSMHPSPGFLNLFEKHAIRRMEQFEQEKLFDLLWAFSVPGLRPSNKFLNAWETEALKRSREWNWRNAKTMLSSYAVFGIQPSEKMLEACRNILERKFPQAQALTVPSIMRALAIVDSLEPHKANGEIAFRINRHFERAFSSSELPRKLARQVSHARLWFDFNFNAIPIPETENIGGYEYRLSGLFRHAGLPLFDKRIKETGHKVDFAVKGPKPVAIEFDGTQHFVKSYSSGKPESFYDGGTLFQSELMAKLEPDLRILRMPYGSTAIFFGNGREKSARTLRDIYCEMLGKSPGNYMLSAGQKSYSIDPLTSLIPV